MNKIEWDILPNDNLMECLDCKHEAKEWAETDNFQEVDQVLTDLATEKLLDKPVLFPHGNPRRLQCHLELRRGIDCIDNTIQLVYQRINGLGFLSKSQKCFGIDISKLLLVGVKNGCVFYFLVHLWIKLHW